MPELPEVEGAARRLRAATSGRRITGVRMLHPSLARRVSAARARALRGARIERVERRGKHQLLVLDDGRVIHVHFRMSGDWVIDTVDRPLPRFARAVLDLDDGTRIVLDDPRALSTVDVHSRGRPPELGLGPEPHDEQLTAEWLHDTLARRRGSIKQALLDQRVVAGIGNIYAAEALWLAGVDPRAPASSLGVAQLARLLTAVRRVIEDATGARYREDASRFAVYDHEGEPCVRCGRAIDRIVQAGRSTYFCPSCQRRSSARQPRGASRRR